MIKFLMMALFLSLSVSAQEITRLLPKKDASYEPGEINFKWQREAGDKSRVLIEVRNKDTGKIVLERVTIGTRRTKTLGEGEYEWRLFQNKKIKDTSWHSFTVGDKAQVQNKVVEVKKKSIVEAPIEKEVIKKEIVKKVEVVSPKKENPMRLSQEKKIFKTVERYIRDRSKNPHLFQVIEWFKPEFNFDAKKVKVKLRYRGVNSYGQLKDQDIIVTLLNQRVVEINSLRD